MKALEILKRICNHGSATVIEIKESIAELEALENRSCDNCKHYGEYEYEICGAEDFTRIVKGCTLILCNFEEGFCCNQWESK